MVSKTKILVAMSGGVDSSVAAALLVEQGHEVIGVFMRLGAEKYTCDTPETPVSLSLPVRGADHAPAAERSKGCCSAEDATDARAVAGQLGIPFYALNFEDQFDRLVDYFVDEYARARTPNPCIRCNQWLKFGSLVSYADVVGAEMIATGHYAQIDHGSDSPRLRRASYLTKDQSYVLFGVDPSILRRTLFPLGDMTKSEVRDHARRLGLTLHDKAESQDICFVPDGDYARLVKSRRDDGFRRGEIRHVDGRLLGEHQGLAHFTIGQRRGLGVAEGIPVYVTDLDPQTGTVTVGPREAVLSNTVRVAQVCWIRTPEGERLEADVKIRYHHQPARAGLTLSGGGRVLVEFAEAQSAVTPGQAAVFYVGDEVIGGGWIEGR